MILVEFGSKSGKFYLNSLNKIFQSLNYFGGEKMNKKIIGIAGILFVLLAAGTAMALENSESNQTQEAKPMYRNFHPELTEETQAQIQERTQQMQELREQIETAIENGDYTTWVSLMTENNNPKHEEMLSAVNQDNFYLLKELQDNRNESMQIMEQLGIEAGQFKEMNGMKQGFRKGFKKGNFNSENCPFNNSTE